MQLKIHHPAEGLLLPKDYQQTILGIIYNNLVLNDSKDFSNMIHSWRGFKDYETGRPAREYKPFTFSPLQGKSQKIDGKLLFLEDVTYEIRSIDPILIAVLYKNIRERGLEYRVNKDGLNVKTSIPRVDLELYDYTVEDTSCFIRMRSPIFVYETVTGVDGKEKKKKSFGPNKEAFYERIQENFRRKYFSFYGQYPESQIELLPVNVRGEDDQHEIVFKGEKLDAWGGAYRLSGERKYLDFLYHTGLGSRNSQGLGVFDVIENENE